MIGVGPSNGVRMPDRSVSRLIRRAPSTAAGRVLKPSVPTSCAQSAAGGTSAECDRADEENAEAAALREKSRSGRRLWTVVAIAVVAAAAAIAASGLLSPLAYLRTMTAPLQ
jgi:hypothetical protein